MVYLWINALNGPMDQYFDHVPNISGTCSEHVLHVCRACCVHVLFMLLICFQLLFHTFSELLPNVFYVIPIHFSYVWHYLHVHPNWLLKITIDYEMIIFIKTWPSGKKTRAIHVLCMRLPHNSWVLACSCTPLWMHGHLSVWLNQLYIYMCVHMAFCFVPNSKTESCIVVSVILQTNLNEIMEWRLVIAYWSLPLYIILKCNH